MTELAVKRPRPPRKSKNAERLVSVVRDIAEMAPKLDPLVADLNDENDRETPADVFDPLHAEFGFTLDVAASAHNAKCVRYCSVGGTYFGKVKLTMENGLQFSWEDERVFCNPPFNLVRPWIERAWDERSEVAVMVLPNNRGEQAFWQDLIEPYRDRVGSILTTRNLRRRRPFVSRVNGQPVVGKSPPFGLVLAIWDRYGQMRPPRSGALNEPSTEI